jgi:tRNA(Ile)-lysidine synthase
VPAAEAGPVAPAEAARIFAPLARYPHVALAVSGGSDSTALLWLIARWRSEAASPPRASVLTVDHGLRPAARAECHSVKAAAAALGLPAHILRWRGRKPATGLQAAAREARYRLLLGWCRKHRAPALLTAHTLEDQAETFLMRLARGSGLDGLAGIADSERDGIAILRPLIGISRARLRATLEAARLTWSEDPSNEDPRFERVRVRTLLAALSRQGLSAAALALSARRLGRARRALEEATAALRAAAVTAEAGAWRIDLALLAAAPEELRIRLLARVLAEASPAGAAPELAAVERLADWAASGKGSARTLAGCRIARRAKVLSVRREPPRRGKRA